MTSRWHGHYWTIYPYLGGMLRPPPPGSRVWRLAEAGPTRYGAERTPATVPLCGEWTDVPGARAVWVVVHGLGGDPTGLHTRRLATDLGRARRSCLNLGLRGSDGSGADLYYAGCVEDVEAALASPELARFDEVHLLGLSMGGHIVLTAAERALDPRLRSVVAVCPPLWMEEVQRHIDRPGSAFYRSQVLGRLKRMYRRFAERHPDRAGVPWREVARLRTVRAFDDAVICPRFGFADPVAYYETVSVAPRLGRLRVPSLVVFSAQDPMVPAASVTPWLAEVGQPVGRSARGGGVVGGAGPDATLAWVESPVGGHLGFPVDVDLGLAPQPGLVPQVLAWAEGPHGGGQVLKQT